MGGQNSQIQLTKSKEWEIDYKNFQGEGEKREVKIKEIEKDIQREQHDFDTFLRDDRLRTRMCRTHSKKSLKEINELVKQQRACRSLICEKSYVQKKQEVLKLKLLHQREFENLLLRQLGILEEEKQAEQQSNAAVSETSIETEVEQEADKNALQSVENELVTVRENIHCLEEQEATFSKQLDAINTMLGSKDEDAAIATNDTLSVEMPTEELTRKDKELDADLSNFQKQQFDTQQKMITFEEALKHEHMNLEQTLRECKSEAGQEEIAKRETADLVRISWKKTFDINQERRMVQLVHYREQESLLLRSISLIEEVEVFYREKGSEKNEEEESKLQKLLPLYREQKENCQKDLLVTQEEIRVVEEEEKAMRKELIFEMPTEELSQKDKQLDVDFINFRKQESDIQQQVRTFEEALKREHENHQLKLRELTIDVHKRKKSLKELGEIMKRETANLLRMSTKKELEINQERRMVQLVYYREKESLFLRRIGIFEEVEVFYREKTGCGKDEDDSKLQELLRLCREQCELYQKDLLAMRENIRVVEEEEMSTRKELDAIDMKVDDNDKDHVPTSTSLSTSITDNPNPKAPPSSLATPPSERQKVLSRGTEKEENGRQILLLNESELMHKNNAFRAEIAIYEKQKADMMVKRREFEEILKRERDNHDLKLRELNADTYSSKKTLKQMGEFMKKETANLVRILRKKELEINQEATMVQLLHLRKYESLQERQIKLIEDNEVFNCEKYGLSKDALPQELLQARLNREKLQRELPVIRENIRVLEEQEMSTSKELDAINKEIDDNVKEHAPTSTSMSTSATDNPPSVPPSSSASPPSARRKVVSHGVEGDMKREEMKEQRGGKAMKAMKDEPSGFHFRNQQAQKEANDKVAEFDEGIRERRADVDKKLVVINDLDRKMAEQMQQLRDKGALEAGRDVVRPNLTAAERQAVEPTCLLYSKYEKLKRSLALEYEKRSHWLNRDVLEFNAKGYKADEKRFMREVDIFESALKEGCDATYRRHYEQQLLQLNQELAKLQQAIVDVANQLSRIDQHLLKLSVMEERTARSMPPLRMPVPPPPPRTRAPHMSAKAGTAASPEEKVVKNNDTRRPIPPSTEDQQIEDIDDDAIDAAAASSAAASRKKKNNRKKSVKSDAQPQTSTDEPSKESISAEIDRSDQPGEAKVIASTSDSNEATALPQLSDGATTTVVIPATASREDDGIVPIDVAAAVAAATALSTVDVENAENTAVQEKKGGINAQGSAPAIPSTNLGSPARATTAAATVIMAVTESIDAPAASVVLAAQSSVKTPLKPLSTSTNPPKPTSTQTPPKPTTPKASPAPAASAATQPPALVPLEKVNVKPRAGMSIISAHDFCAACRELEQARTKGREIVSYFPRGFVNTGNACYRNSVLQSLLASPPLIRLLSALSDNAGRMPSTMPVWCEVLTLSSELANEPLPQLYKKKSPPVTSSTSSGQAGKAPDQAASVKPQALAAASQGAATRGPSGSNVGVGKSLSGTSSGGGTGSMNVLGGDTLTPDAYFAKTFYEFRRKMARLRGEAPPPEVSGPGSVSSTVERPRIPQEDAMEFMTFLLESLNEEIAGMDEESEKAAAEKEAKQNSGWESVSTTKTKTKVQNVIDDTSRMNSAKGNAATTVTRLFYGTLRSVVCYPANKSSANKKINSATFQPFSNLNLNITEPMELTGPYSLQNFKRESATALVASSPVSTLSNEPLQQCLLPPLTLGRALEGYFQSTPLDEGTYKTIQFEHLPQVLVLQLDRFSYDYDLNVLNKIDREIRYPMTLDLPTNMLSAELIDQLQEEAANEPGRNNSININMCSAIKVSYSLVAVVRHHGATATSGHYTALCRDNKRTSSSAPTGSSISSTATAASAIGPTETGTTAAAASKWGWEYDDAKVTAITAEDALQATQTAYILLYCRN